MMSNKAKLLGLLLTLMCYSASIAQDRESEINREYLKILETIAEENNNLSANIPTKHLEAPSVFKPAGKLGWEIGGILEARSTLRKNLIDALERPEYQAMRSYVIYHFPDYAPKNVTNGLVPLNGVKPTSDINFFIQNMISEQGLFRRFDIETTPDNAVFRLWPKAGGDVISTTSNSSLTVYRGLYEYSVERSGYKIIEEELNLVDERVSLLECELHRLEDNSGPNPCRRR